MTYVCTRGGMCRIHSTVFGAFSVVGCTSKVAHRDLKPANILLSSDCKLKAPVRNIDVTWVSV